MASGSFIGSKYGRNSNYYLAVAYASSPNNANNNSTLDVTVTFYRSALYLGSRPGYIYVTYTDDDGASHTLTYSTTIASVSSSANANYQIMKASFTVPHKTSGAQTVTIRAVYNTKDLTLTNYGTVANIEASKSGITLDTIPRAGSITSISGNTIGSKITVSINKASTSYTHKLIYQKPNGTNVTESSNVSGTSFSFTPDINDCSLITNSDHGTAKIILETYSGSTKIGSDEKSITLYVPESVKPTVNSVTVERINENSVVAGWGIWLKGYSKAKISASVSTAYGSAIKSYSISGGGFTGNTAQYTTGLLKSATETKFTYKVVDGRERPASKDSGAISVIDYYSPMMTSPPQWYRCGADGTASDSGQYIKMLVNVDCASCAGNNSVSVELLYKKKSASSYQSLGALTNHAWTILGNNNVLSSASYDIRVVATDLLGETATYNDTVPTEDVAFNLKKGGKGAAFGKISETDNLLDSAWDIKAPNINISGSAKAKVLYAQGDANGGLHIPSTLDEKRKWWLFNYIVNGTDYNKLSIRSTNTNGYYADYYLSGKDDGDSTNTAYNILTAKDLEYGTWTPKFVFGTFTYTTQSGSYFKIGKMVYIQCELRTSAATLSSNGLVVGGIPFTPAKYAFMSGILDTVTGSINYRIALRADPGNNFIRCLVGTSGKTGLSTITTQYPTGAASVQFSGWYQIS